jgi:hypothetical protein
MARTHRILTTLDVDALPSLLLGLVGGLVGGTAAAIGWTVPTRRRLLRAAAAPEQPQGA